MCGIAALLFTPSAAVSAPRDIVSRMLEATRSRGPDGCGIVEVPRPRSTSVWLGHVRLAIVDPSPTGSQPMTDPETGNWIVFNGEIYNHRAVRAVLGDEGPAWRSTSDTETLLRAYARWGEACLDRLRGMFAFVLWDQRQGIAWCVRDRLGIKPLYHAETRSGVAIASEVQALHHVGWAPGSIDDVGLAGYLRWGCVPEPLGLVTGVRALPAGHAMTVRDGHVESVQRWWRPEDALRQGGAGLRGGALRRQLSEAVAEHMESDVPVSFFLSGGIDSTVLAGLAAERLGPGVPAVTLGWADAEFDETEAARAVARRHGLAHEVVRLSDDDAAAEAVRCVERMDLPTIDGLNTWLVSRAVRIAGFKVAVSGLGGDELFGGYPTFGRLAWAERWAPLLQFLPRRPAGGWFRWERVLRLQEVIAPRAPLRARYAATRAVWSRAALRRAGVSAAPVLAVDEPDASLPVATRVSLLESQCYMRSMLLRDADQMGMGQSLEIRVPFLDHRTVEGVWASGGAEPGGKARLLEAAGDLVPPALQGARKRGFVLPMEAWLRGSLSSYLREGLAKTEALGLVRTPFVRRVESAFARRRISWSRPWQLAVLGHWATHRNVRGAA